MRMVRLLGSSNYNVQFNPGRYIIVTEAVRKDSAGSKSKSSNSGTDAETSGKRRKRGKGTRSSGNADIAGGEAVSPSAKVVNGKDVSYEEGAEDQAKAKGRKAKTKVKAKRETDARDERVGGGKSRKGSPHTISPADSHSGLAVSSISANGDAAARNEVWEGSGGDESGIGNGNDDEEQDVDDDDDDGDEEEEEEEEEEEYEYEERVLHLQCGNMFDIKNIDIADVVMMETDIPTDLYPELQQLLSRMHDSSRLLTYLELRKVWMGVDGTQAGLPFKQLDLNKHLSDRYPTSWSVQRGHHFYLWNKVII